MDDLRSVMYLTSPVQPAVGWRCLQALYGVMQSVDVDPAVRPVPARQISFQNNLTRTIFDEVHRLGQWVVNYDDLLTRRQLRNQGVQIIRYQQHPHGGRKMTISSRAPLNLLEVLVQRRLYSLNLDLDPNELRDLTRRMVDDANTISGDIVLRAAKRGQFASELIGLVLSRFLLQDELGNAGCCGWYFLDDYVMWLGQREERLAVSRSSFAFSLFRPFAISSDKEAGDGWPDGPGRAVVHATWPPASLRSSRELRVESPEAERG